MRRGYYVMTGSQFELATQLEPNEGLHHTPKMRLISEMLPLPMLKALQLRPTHLIIGQVCWATILCLEYWEQHVTAMPA